MGAGGESPAAPAAGDDLRETLAGIGTQLRDQVQTLDAVLDMTGVVAGRELVAGVRKRLADLATCAALESGS